MMQNFMALMPIGEPLWPESMGGKEQHLAPRDLALLVCLSEIHFGKFQYVCCYIIECRHKHGPDFYPRGPPGFPGVRIGLPEHYALDF